MKPYSFGNELSTFSGRSWATVGSMRCTTPSLDTLSPSGAGNATAIDDALQTSGSPDDAFVRVCATLIVGTVASSGHTTLQRHGIGADVMTSAVFVTTRASHGTSVPAAGWGFVSGNQNPFCTA